MMAKEEAKDEGSEMSRNVQTTDMKFFKKYS
jgi:hypothetical protein